MNKKLIALAVGAAISAPAFAQSTGNVTIYGKVNAGFEFTKVSNGGVSKNRVADQTSIIGFKGSEALGNGLNAVWQIESGFDVSGDNNGAGVADNSGAVNNTSQSGRIASRNSFVGLNGGFGTVVLGRHDTPYKLSTQKLNLFSGTTADYNAIVGLGANNFDLRANNALAYLSPNFNGFDFKVAYVANEAKQKAGGATLNPNAWSLSATYDANNIFATYAYEKHSDFNGAVTSTNLANVGTDKEAKAHKIGVAYTFGPAMVGALWERVKRDQTGSSVKNTNYGLFAKYSVGNVDLKGEYMRAKDSKGTNVTVDDGAKFWVIGADYNLSKRTALYAQYAKINNDTVGTRTFGVNGLAVGNNQDPSVLGVGIKHSF